MSSQEAQALYERLKREGEAAGYYLNPDVEFVLDLMEGLLTNEERYGYPSCPCRLAEGVREKDLDIICPCDYRDPDLEDYGTCFCSLYVSEEVVEGGKEAKSIPERRPSEVERKLANKKKGVHSEGEGVKVFRCKVCGYLCARENPPERCPICKAQKERFEEFDLTGS